MSHPIINFSSILHGNHVVNSSSDMSMCMKNYDYDYDYEYVYEEEYDIMIES